MKVGIQIGSSTSSFIPVIVFSIPIIILYALIEMALFFGCRKFLFAVTLSFRTIFMLHDVGYGIYYAVEAGDFYVEWYCEEGTNSSSIQQYCREDACWWDCNYPTYDCDACVGDCVQFYNNTIQFCTDNNSMIASSTIFFISLLLGIATVVVFSKLPRDPCCGPCCYPKISSSSQQVYSMQAAQPTSGMVSNFTSLYFLKSLFSEFNQP